MGNKRIQPTYQGKEYRSLRALAIDLDVDPKVLKRRIEEGLPENEWGAQSPPKPTYTREELQELLDQRLSYPRIAEKLGTTQAGIEGRVARWRLKRPPALSEVLTEEILLVAMEEGLSRRELAERHGFVSQSPVVDACQRHGLEWTPRKVFKPRLQGSHLTAVSYQGKDYPSVSDLARAINISYSTLLSRINNKWPEGRWAEPLKDYDRDISGETFHRLAAIRLTQRASRELNRGQQWLFQCECGKMVQAYKGNVLNGNTRSCGCLKAERNRDVFGKDHLPGEVFGELTVLGPAGKGGDHGQRLLWKCKCSCGKVTVVSGKNLRNGNTRSCGHLAGTRDDLTGNVFERLTVTDLVLAKPGAGGQRIWLCDCQCGNTVEVATASLVNGNTRSCGCLKSEKAVLNFRNEGVEAYRLDPDYAERDSYVYLVEVAGVVDKIGIAFDIDARGRSGSYTEVWWIRELSRAQCWAVEQVALSLTRDWAPDEPYYDEHGHSGPSEQRTGWVLDEVILMLDALCEEAIELDWEQMLNKYSLD